MIKPNEKKLRNFPKIEIQTFQSTIIQLIFLWLTPQHTIRKSLVIDDFLLGYIIHGFNCDLFITHEVSIS